MHIISKKGYLTFSRFRFINGFKHFPTPLDQELLKDAWTEEDRHTKEIMDKVIVEAGEIDICKLVEEVSLRLGVDPNDKNTNVRHVLWAGLGSETGWYAMSSDRKISK